jgi:hypothetical protein
MRTVLSRLRRAHTGADGATSVDAAAAVPLGDADRTGAASRRLAVLYCAVAGMEAEGRAFAACEARCSDVRTRRSLLPLRADCSAAQALQYDPGCAAALAQRGWARLSQGRPADAAADAVRGGQPAGGRDLMRKQERALELDPQLESARKLVCALPTWACKS